MSGKILKPEYLKRPLLDTDKTRTVRRILKRNCLNTVCENARCPNKNECYSKNTATFLIMGNVCTRNCRYCNIGCAAPEPLNPDEPEQIAQAVRELGLEYVVITSVTRDDLSDGGAEHFANCIRAISGARVEVLTPDFRGDTAALEVITAAKPDVFNHNIETVRALFPFVRPQADYDCSLEVLRYMGGLTTKSGLMVGLGESLEQIEETLSDLKEVGCDILTIGQYIAPSKAHHPVAKYYTPEEFERLRDLAQKIGFKHYKIEPLARSSYHAAALMI
jgi:lipoic acid synthetase